MRPIKFILFILLFAFIIVSATFEINDPDTANYLAVGKYIVQHGFPHTNIFSFTIPDYQMNIPEWLAEVIVYLTYAAGNYSAMVALQIFLDVAIFFVIFLICRAQKYSLFSTLAVMLVAVIIATERFMLRSELFGALCGVLILYLLVLYQKNETKLIYLAIPIQLFWVNFHGSFPLAFILIPAFLAPPVLKAAWQKYYHNKPADLFPKKTKVLAIVLLLVVLISFCNRDGIKGFFWPFKMMTQDMEFLATQNLEFQSPFKAGEFQKIAIVTYKEFLLFSIIILALNGFRLQLVHLFLFLPFVYLSVQSLRQVSLFAIFTATFLPGYIDSSWASLNSLLSRFKKKITIKSQNWQLLFAIPFLVIVIFLIYQTATNKIYFRDLRSRRFGFGVTELMYAEEAVKFIKENKIEGNGFNDYSTGTYLNWRLWPDKKNFIDGHTFSPDLFKYYQEVITDQAEFDKAIEKYNINYALVNHGVGTNYNLINKIYADKKWQLIYFDEICVIFVLKDNPANKELIEKYAVDFKENKNFDPDRLKAIKRPVNFSAGWNSRGSFLANIDMTEKAITQFEKAAAINPNDHIIQYNLGTLYLRMNKFDEALKSYEKSVKLVSNYPASHFGLASLYQQKNLLDEALSEYQKTIRLNNNYPNAHYNLGTLYEKKNLTDKALAEYKTELRINPNQTQTQNAISRLEQQKTPEGKGESIEELTKLIAESPNNAELHLRLGVAYGLKEQTEPAIDEFKKAVELDDSLMLAHFNLANAYTVRNMFAEAAEEYKKVVEIKPDFAQAFLNLGVIFRYKLPNKAEAIKYWQKYVDLNPEDQQLETIRQELEKMKQENSSLPTTGE